MTEAKVKTISSLAEHKHEKLIFPGLLEFTGPSKVVQSCQMKLIPGLKINSVVRFSEAPKRESIRQFLIKNGIIRVELKKKSLISGINKQKRIEFAKKYLEKGP